MIRALLLSSVLAMVVAAAPAARAQSDLLVILDTIARGVDPGSPLDRYLDHALLQAGPQTRVQIVDATAATATMLVDTRLRARPGLRGHQKLAIRRILDRWLQDTGDAELPPPERLGKTVIDRLRAASPETGHGLRLILISDLLATPPAASALRQATAYPLDVKVLGPQRGTTAEEADQAAPWGRRMTQAGASWSYLPLAGSDPWPAAAGDQADPSTGD